MALARINGITLSYDDYGAGDPVVMITGTGAPGRIWRTHQVPALRAAGHRVITVDNRGIPPTEAGSEPFTLADLVDDVAALIGFLGIRPVRLVGFSLGALVVQELLVRRPELARQAVLIGTQGRTDALSAAVSAAEIELADAGVKIPSRYAAIVTALRNLSPRTLNDPDRLRDWLDILELSPADPAAVRAQLGLELLGDRLAAYRTIGCPCLVIGFGDDLVVRPHLSREVADAIPGARYREIAGCGHFGCLERPDEVNAAIVDFFSPAAGTGR